MAIGDRQLKILEVINAGHTTGEEIVDVTGSSMQMLSYYMNQMVEDGYIKAARVYDNELRDFVVVRAYLTAEGEAILAQMGKSSPPTPTVASTAEPSTIDNASSLSATAASENVTKMPSDYGVVSGCIEQIATIVGNLPADWRELAEVYLDDLKNEVNIAYRRRPARIRAYFLALLRLLLPVVSKLADGEAFVQQVRILSKELGIPVKLPEPNS